MSEGFITNKGSRNFDYDICSLRYFFFSDCACNEKEKFLKEEYKIKKYDEVSIRIL